MGLYLAAKTKRVLLMAWQRPKELENFFLPNNNNKNLLVLDWRVPTQAKFGFDDMEHVRNFTQLFEKYAEDHPDNEFWNVHMDALLERALDDDSHHFSQRVLRHRLLGHLNEKLHCSRKNCIERDFMTTIRIIPRPNCTSRRPLEPFFICFFN